MKVKFLTIFSNFLVGLVATVSTVAAQPAWEFLPQDYEYSMTITGKVTTDGNYSADENDVVGVFVNNECRGLAKLKYEFPLNAYYAYLFVYGTAPGEKLTFKIYDASENLIISTKDTLNFIINSILGSPDEPVLFSSNLLNSETELLSFSASSQIGETVFTGNNVYLSVNSTSLTEIIPTFVASSNAKVLANEQVQVSGVTANNFSAPLEYKVVSEDLSDTSVYTVHIELNENDPPTAINLSNTLIHVSTGVNTIVATLSAEDLDEGDSHDFDLVEGDGSNDSENHLFAIEGNYLILKQQLNFNDQDVLNMRVRASDSQDAVFIQNVHLTVTTENEAPQFLSTPPTSVLQDENFMYTIEISGNGGGELTIENLPVWLSYNAASNTISGLAKNEHVGDYSFTIKANNGNMEAVQPVEFAVVNVNDAPQIKYPIEDQFFVSMRENQIHFPEGYYLDPDVDDSITFSIKMQDDSELPDWLNFDSQTRILSGTPPDGNTESLFLKLIAADKGSLQQSLNFKIEINLPTATGDLKQNKLLKCYPNPVRNKLIVKIPANKEDAQISVLNSEGRLLNSFLINSGSRNEISFEEMQPGIYVVRSQQGNQVQIRKIIKR